MSEVPISSNSSKGEGNTKTSPSLKKPQISPAKRWCFTLNNFTKDDVNDISSKFKSACKVAIIGYEKGEEGTPHLQGYCEFQNKIRPVSLGLTTRIHWEKCKGNRQDNIDYCRKEGNECFHSGCLGRS